MCTQDDSILSSPCFETQGDWSAGYLLAKENGGAGVVVGPKADAPNVFAQSFPVGPEPNYKVVTEATSADGAPTQAAIQINWIDGTNQFLGASRAVFPVDKDDQTFKLYVTAPVGAETGVLYVAPGGDSLHPVRYTQMTLTQTSPTERFFADHFFGIPAPIGISIIISIVALLVIAAFRPQLVLRTVRAALALLFRPLSVLAVFLCIVAAFFLGQPNYSNAPKCLSSGQVLTSPCFETQGNWSAGYVLAKENGGAGVVVGPKEDAPNVFAQSFSVGFNLSYKLLVEAACVGGDLTRAAVQVNWFDDTGELIGASSAAFPVSKNGTPFELDITAPPGATTGDLYVRPGDHAPHAVRYTQMELLPGNPVTGFFAHHVLGLPVPVAILMTALLAMTAFHPHRTTRALQKAGALFIRLLPLLATMLCIGMAFFLDAEYEQHYDAHYHQGWVETLFTWTVPSLDLGGSPMSSFGIQLPSNPWLAPDLLIGQMVPIDIRIPVQISVLAVTALFCLVALARTAGANRVGSFAIALIAVAYCWVPAFSDNTFSLNPTLGTFWQESAVAALIATICFLRIGTTSGRFALWPEIGLTLTILWHLFALPYTVPYFVLATSMLCAGALLSVDSRKELLRKLVSSAAILAGLLVIGTKEYVVNLFSYTPQMFYSTLYPVDFSAFYGNTSFLFMAQFPDNWRVYAFYGLAALGGVIALRTGNRFARHLAFIGVGFEVLIHAASTLNQMLHVLPLSFTYVEQIGFPIVAMLAGIGLWAVLHRVGEAILSPFWETAPVAPSSETERLHHASNGS